MDSVLIRKLDEFEKRISDLEGHKDDRIRELETANDQLTQRVEALEKRKK